MSELVTEQQHGQWSIQTHWNQQGLFSGFYSWEAFLDGEKILDSKDEGPHECDEEAIDSALSAIKIYEDWC